MLIAISDIQSRKFATCCSGIQLVFPQNRTVKKNLRRLKLAWIHWKDAKLIQTQKLVWQPFHYYGVCIYLTYPFWGDKILYLTNAFLVDFCLFVFLLCFSSVDCWNWMVCFSFLPHHPSWVQEIYITFFNLPLSNHCFTIYCSGLEMHYFRSAKAAIMKSVVI